MGVSGPLGAIGSAEITNGSLRDEDISVTAAIAIGKIAGLGSAASLSVGTTAGTVAAGDHAHAVATSVVAGFMSAADKTKLSGIAVGADMLKSVYDADSDGKVDAAATAGTALDASKLNGQPASYYLDAGNIAETAGRKWLTDTERTKLTGISSGADITNATTVAAAGAVMNNDFLSDGLMLRSGAGTYTVVNNNSADWNTAYGWGDHASAGYLMSSSWASPGAIGATLPNTGVFSTLSVNTDLVLNGVGSAAVIRGPASGGSYTLTLPTSAGALGNVLTADGSGGLSWTAGGGSGPADTDALTEGTTRLYFTDARARSALTALSPMALNPVTGQIGMTVASGVSDGYITASDYLTFGSKQSPLTAASNLTLDNLVANSLTAGVALNLADDDASATVTIKAKDTTTASYTLTLPNDDGDADQILRTDGSGTLSWITPVVSGDMLKSSYDTNSNNQADVADNAVALGGNAASFYLDASNLSAGTMPDARISANIARTSALPNFAAPGAIGATTPAAGTFNVLQANAGLKLKDGDTNTVTVLSPALAADYSLTLPDRQGALNEVMQINNSGVLQWVTMQAFSDGLLNFSNESFSASADELIYATGQDQFATTPFTGQARLLLADASFSAMRTRIGAQAAIIDTTDVTLNIMTVKDMLRLEDPGGNPNAIGIRAPNLSLGGYTLTLPQNNGNANDVLGTNGNGILSWVENPTFTTGDARAAISVAAAPLTYNSATGVISIGAASAGAAGFISGAQFTSFSAAGTAVANASSANTASRLVERDASGNFAGNEVAAKVLAMSAPGSVPACIGGTNDGKIWIEGQAKPFACLNGVKMAIQVKPTFHIASGTKTVFVTSRKFSVTELNSRAKIDTICAGTASLTGSATKFIGFMSAYSAGDHISNYLTFGGNGTFNSRGVQVSTDGGFWTASTTPFTAAITDEYGQILPAGEFAWTMTSSNGLVNIYSCTNLSSSSSVVTGAVGNPNASTEPWRTSSPQPCDSQQHLYCISQ